ncbi:MAG TPA: GIDE domain-containing protein [Solimonas sp.]|nr:GIDE domain-containing protein [Solimonas sp.]
MDQGLAALAAGIAGADAGTYWLWVLIGGGATLGSFVYSFLALRHGRLIEDTPTSRIRSAAQGYVELEGFARLLPGPDIRSPLTGARCAWWEYTIERRETVYRNGKRTSEWSTIEHLRSDSLFLLCDDTGECVVDPEGAKIHPSRKRRWQGSSAKPGFVPEHPGWLQWGDYRYSEWLVQVGDPLYATGQFRSQTNAPHYDEAEDLDELLTRWKADHALLLRGYDRNRDGVLDVAEWEQVRRKALQEVRARHVQRSLHPEVHVLSRPTDGRPFLVSTRSQAELARGMKLKSLFSLMFSFCTGAATVFALLARGLP